jgi:hypothetical protein
VHRNGSTRLAAPPRRMSFIGSTIIQIAAQ